MSETQVDLLERITTLIEEGDSIEVDLPVDTGYFVLDPELLSAVERLLSNAIGLLDEVGRYFEGQEMLEEEAHAQQPEGLSLAGLAADLSSELANREIADLALIGRNGLLEVADELTAARGQKNFWQVASATDGALGRLGRALIPIESALREGGGLPPMRRRWEDLDDSLEIRHQYGQLWRDAQRIETDDPASVREGLTRFAKRLAHLRQLTIYPFLRIDDRLELRRLQKQTLAHLAHGDGASNFAGKTLWSEVHSALDRLMRINDRQELREHDRDLVVRGFREIQESRYANAIPGQVLERLEPLIGRDAALDRVLLHPDDHCPADCLAPLDRLRNDLLATSSPGFRR